MLKQLKLQWIWLKLLFASSDSVKYIVQLSFLLERRLFHDYDITAWDLYLNI